MANVKISELPAASALTGSEDLPSVQSNVTRKTKTRDIAKLGYQDIVTESAGTRTLALTDIGGWLRFTNASAVTLTVPNNTSVAFPVGTSLNGIQAAAGSLTFSPASGVTVNKPTGYEFKTRAQGSAWCLVKIGTNTWDLVGDLEATV